MINVGTINGYLLGIISTAGREIEVNSVESMHWFKGKFTGNHGFYHQL